MAAPCHYCPLLVLVSIHSSSRTQPHLAANANAEDPRAMARLPSDSPPDNVQLVRCSQPQLNLNSSNGTPGYGEATVDKVVQSLLCWSDRQSSALALCDAGKA